jgi:SAM-dependent methyltransferase
MTSYHLGKSTKLRAILEYFNLSRSVKADFALDVGVGTGGLASVYHSYFPSWTNIEPDEHFAEIARKLLSEKVLSSIDEVEDEKFDLITLIDVFFYFSDSDAYLEKMRELLDHKGRIVITLTNADNSLLFNRLRNSLGLGSEARGFKVEEPAAKVVDRFTKTGFRQIYYKQFCYPVEEAILLVMDYVVTFARGEHGKKKIEQIGEIGRSGLWLLKISWVILKTLSFLDYPFRPFLSGYRFIAVFDKSGE